MKRDLDSGLIIFGMLIGLIAGGLVTLFYSPLDGRALRRTAELEVDQLRANARGNIDQMRQNVDQVRTNIEQVRTDKVSASINEGREAIRARTQTPPLVG